MPIGVNLVRTRVATPRATVLRAAPPSQHTSPHNAACAVDVNVPIRVRGAGQPAPEHRRRPGNRNALLFHAGLPVVRPSPTDAHAPQDVGLSRGAPLPEVAESAVNLFELVVLHHARFGRHRGMAVARAPRGNCGGVALEPNWLRSTWTVMLFASAAQLAACSKPLFCCHNLVTAPAHPAMGATRPRNRVGAGGRGPSATTLPLRRPGNARSNGVARPMASPIKGRSALGRNLAQNGYE